MDTNLLRAVVTLCGLCIFIALVVWAWLPARRALHAQAAQLPFLDDADEADAGKKRGGAQ